MGFLGSIIQAAVRTASLPVQAIGDIITGDEKTKETISKIGDDIGEATDDLCDGDLI